MFVYATIFGTRVTGLAIHFHPHPIPPLPEQRKEMAEVSPPFRRPKKRRVVLAESESPLIEGNLKSPQTSAPTRAKLPLITSSAKLPTTSAPMNDFGD